MSIAKTDPTFRYRWSYARQEPAIWLGHLDMMRTFERALRRAGLPLSYTQGFNPRPRLVFALPIGVGLETKADLFDVWLTREGDEKAWLKALNQALPQGLEASSIEPVRAEQKSLMSLVTAAEYWLDAPGIDAAWQALQNAPLGEWLVEKKSKGKTRSVDIRPWVKAVTVCSPDRLWLKARAGSQANLRPDLFLQALCQHAGFSQDEALEARITRTRLHLEGKQPSEKRESLTAKAGDADEKGT